MSATTPSRTAIHESAHAVVALYFGYQAGVVRLTPDHPKHSGYMMSGSFRDADPIEWSVVLLAGRAATRELCPDVMEPAWSGSQDRHQASDLLEITEGAHAEARLKHAERTAWALVHKHRNLIFAVATELDRRGVLDHAEIREIIAANQETR